MVNAFKISRKSKGNTFQFEVGKRCEIAGVLSVCREPLDISFRLQNYLQPAQVFQLTSVLHVHIRAACIIRAACTHPCRMYTCMYMYTSIHIRAVYRMYNPCCMYTSLPHVYTRAACIIEGCAVKSDELSTVFGWPHLQALRNYLKSVLVYKCINGLAPSYLLCEFRHAHQIHSHFTRHRDQLRLPLAETTKYQGSFRINGACAYNSLPSNIRSTKDFNMFKSLAKWHFKRQCVQSL